MIRHLLTAARRALDYRRRALAAETAMLVLSVEVLRLRIALAEERSARIDADYQACRADARRRVWS